MLGLDWMTGSFGVDTLVGVTVLTVTVTLTARQDAKAARHLRHEVVRAGSSRPDRRR